MSKLRMGVRLSELPSMNKLDLSKDDIILLTDSIYDSNVSKKFTIDEFLKSDIVKDAIKSSIDLTKYVTIEDQDQFILGNKRFIKLIAEDAEIVLALIRRLSTGLDCITPGEYSRSGGIISKSYGNYSVAEGDDCISIADNSMVIGTSAMSLKDHTYSYVWSGVKSVDNYKSHGSGTFNINPVDGLDGIYIGEDTLKNLITELIPDVDNDTLIKNDNIIKVNTEVISTKDYVDNLVNNIPSYILPTASSTKLGGVKVGSNLSITNGSLSVDINLVNKVNNNSNNIQSEIDRVTELETTIQDSIDNINSILVNKADKFYVDDLVNDSKVDVSNNTLVNDDNSLSVNTEVISTKDYVDTEVGKVRLTGDDTSIKVEDQVIKVNTNTIATKAYVDTKIDDLGNLVHIDGNETITGTKTFNKLNLVDNPVIEVNKYEPPPQPTWDIPSDTVTITDDMVNLTSGIYLLNSDRVKPLIIESNESVVIYISKKDNNGNELNINFNPDGLYRSFIHVKLKAELKVYNNTNIFNNGTGGGYFSNVINDGICYLYGGSYYNVGTPDSTGIAQHWYNLVNRSGHMEIHNCLVSYKVSNASSIINNGVQTLYTSDLDSSYSSDELNELISNNPSMLITDGLFGGNNSTGSIKNETRGTLIIDNGKFFSDGGQCIQNEGHLTINNGYFYRTYTIDKDTGELTKPKGRLIINGYNNPSAVLIMNDGYYETTESVYIALCNTGSQYYIKPVIYGGIFGLDNCIISYKGNLTSEYVREVLLNYSGNNYYIQHCTIDGVIKYMVRSIDLLNGIKSVNGLIADHMGLMITGVNTLNNPTSVVNKDYVDSRMISITNEGVDLVNSLNILIDSSNSVEMMDSINKIIKLFRYIYLKEPIT